MPSDAVTAPSSITTPEEWQPHLPLKATAITAVAIGIMSEFGMPGSILALPTGTILLALVIRCARKDVSVWRPGLGPAALASWLAVLIAPGLLTLSMHWLCLFGLALCAGGHRLRHVAETTVLSALLNSVRATPMGVVRDFHVREQVQLLARKNPGLFALNNLVLPLVTLVLFTTLLVSANPMMKALLQGRFDRILSGWSFPSALLAFVLLMAVGTARPLKRALQWDKDLPESHWRSVLLNPTSLFSTLVLLNILFAVANIFDFRYVWLAGKLPQALTHAEYVHRGSYTLIATAILAALLIVFGLRPGSSTEASPGLRKLVYFWIFQNVFLVASSAQRTLAYVEDYGMTMWRLCGLVWMAIVAMGLVLVAIRIMRRRGNQWLTNANLAVCLFTLLTCGLADLRWVVAEWNATAAIERRGAPLDRAYMQELGPSAIPALIRLNKAGFQVNLACEPNPIRPACFHNAAPFH